MTLQVLHEESIYRIHPNQPQLTYLPNTAFASQSSTEARPGPGVNSYTYIDGWIPAPWGGKKPFQCMYIIMNHDTSWT